MATDQACLARRGLTVGMRAIRIDRALDWTSLRRRNRMVLAPASEREPEREVHRSPVFTLFGGGVESDIEANRADREFVAEPNS